MSVPGVVAPPPPSPRRRVPAWLFGITGIAFGVSGAFSGIVLPFLLGRAGLPVERRAEITAWALWPAALQFLWAPVLDLGPRRRSWLLLLAAGAAATAAAALLVPLPAGLGLFVPLAVASAVCGSLIGPCNGALVATVLSDDVRGKAAGWLSAGNLGGGALAAWAIITAIGRQPVPVVAALAAALTFLPALAVLAIPEAVGPRVRAAAVFGAMGRGAAATLRRRWFGVLVCLSPVGTAALLNMFSGMGDDWHASQDTVAFVAGASGGLVSAVGALLGGWACDRVDRRVAYLAAGALTAVVALVMAAAPMTPAVYRAGVLAYLFVAGLCYAAFAAFVFEIVGAVDAGAATQYTLFSAAGNLAITYVVLLDGQGGKHWGPRGVLRTDAAANLAGIAALILVLFVAHRGRRGGTPPRAGASTEADRAG